MTSGGTWTDAPAGAPTTPGTFQGPRPTGSDCVPEGLAAFLAGPGRALAVEVFDAPVVNLGAPLGFPVPCPKMDDPWAARPATTTGTSYANCAPRTAVRRTTTRGRGVSRDRA